MFSGIKTQIYKYFTKTQQNQARVYNLKQYIHTHIHIHTYFLTRVLLDIFLNIMYNTKSIASIKSYLYMYIQI